MTKSTFSVTTHEYEQRRHVFETHRWINSVMTRMGENPEFDSNYFERTGNIKKLIEEAIPLTYLGAC